MMGTVRVLAVATSAAMAVLAFASTANADTAISLTNEHTSSPCNVAVQNCKVAVHSEGHATLRGHPFGFESTDSQCFVEYTAYFDADGSGHIVDQQLTGGDECTRRPCTFAPEDEWDFTSEETGPDQYEMLMRFCIEDRETGDDPVHCTLDLIVNRTDHSNLELAAEDPGQPDHARRCESDTSSAIVEVENHSVSEPAESDEIAVTHL